MNDKIAASREALWAFGRHYHYDVSYIEELMDASPGAFQVFEATMPMGQYQKAAPADLLAIVKIAAMRAEDCGPCSELGVKKAREMGVAEEVIRGAWYAGEGLGAEHREVYDYARAVATNGAMDADLLPRLQKRLGREVMAELALAIVATRLYPTLKRALGHGKSCSLMPELVA